jgi:ligand-binding sensor domain-containing protein
LDRERWRSQSVQSQAVPNGHPLFLTYLPDQHPNALRVNALAEDPSGAIWCATYNGLYRLDRSGDKVKFQGVDIGLPGEANEGQLINNISLDRRGALWLAARTGLYRRLAGRSTAQPATDCPTISPKRCSMTAAAGGG